MTDTKSTKSATTAEGSKKPDWRAKVRNALSTLGGPANLQELYRAVETQFPQALTRKHWKAKIRQIVQKDPAIERVEHGVWRLRGD